MSIVNTEPILPEITEEDEEIIKTMGGITLIRTDGSTFEVKSKG